MTSAHLKPINSNVFVDCFMDNTDLQDLSVLRINGEPFLHEKIQLLRATSIEESLKQWVSLQKAFEHQLQQTAVLFEGERRRALAELQTRLRSLVE